MRPCSGSVARGTEPESRGRCGHLARRSEAGLEQSQLAILVVRVEVLELDDLELLEGQRREIDGRRVVVVVRDFDLDLQRVGAKLVTPQVVALT